MSEILTLLNHRGEPQIAVGPFQTRKETMDFWREAKAAYNGYTIIDFMTPEEYRVPAQSTSQHPSSFVGGVA